MQLHPTAAAALALASQQIIGSPMGSLPFHSSSGLAQPPQIQPEFKASWSQNVWSPTYSHAASGYLYNSPSQEKVRVDMAYDGVLGSSLFNYSNTSEQGVHNTLWILTPAIASTPRIQSGYVDPAFPLVAADLLSAAKAVFGGTMDDPVMGRVSTWNIMYRSRLPAAVFVDDDNKIRGYDFWDTNTQMFSKTRLFNIESGSIPANVFDFPHQEKEMAKL